jgi:hypothetical protein
MLWMKAWFETRWRLVFVLCFSLFPLMLRYANGTPQSSAEQLPRSLGAFAIFWAIGSAMLAGSGVKTQSANFQAARGGHTSVSFTLSLPVSRFRLLAVRTAMGLLEMTAVIITVNAALWFSFLNQTFTASAMIRHGLVVLICSSTFYFLSTLISTSFEEIYQSWGNMLLIFILAALSARDVLPRSMDILAAMGKESPLFMGTLPWRPMIVAIVLSASLFFHALHIVRTRDY